MDRVLGNVSGATTFFYFFFVFAHIQSSQPGDKRSGYSSTANTPYRRGAYVFCEKEGALLCTHVCMCVRSVCNVGVRVRV